MIEALIALWVWMAAALSGVFVEPIESFNREDPPIVNPVMDHSPAWGSDTVNRLISCESRGDPTVVSGAGAHGLFQFHLPSWRLVGGEGLPSQASVAEQTMRAKLLWDRQGWHGWPGCTCYFGWIKSWTYDGVTHHCGSERRT